MSVFETKYKKHFELCGELLSLALRALPLIPPPSRTYGEVITAFFIKGLNSLRSVILLCKQGLGDDAGLILRSLLNLAYLVKWTEQDKEARAARFLGWFWKERIELVESLGETPSANERAEWDKVKHLFEYTDKKGVTRMFQNWYGNATIRELAASLQEDKPPPHNYRTHAELHYMDGYKILSHIEHSNPFAATAFLRRNKGPYLNSYLWQDELVHEVLKGAFQYFYLIFEALNGHYGLIPAEDVHKLFEEAREYFQRFQQGEAGRKN